MYNVGLQQRQQVAKVMWHKTALPSYRRFTIFARWRQCAPPSSTPQSASAPYQCCHLLSRCKNINYQTCPGMYWAGPFRVCRSGHQSSTRFLGTIRVHNQNGISIGSAIFAGLTIITDRQTIGQAISICSNKPHLATAAMWPNNILIMWLNFLKFCISGKCLPPVWQIYSKYIICYMQCTHDRRTESFLTNGNVYSVI